MHVLPLMLRVPLLGIAFGLFLKFRVLLFNLLLLVRQIICGVLHLLGGFADLLRQLKGLLVIIHAECGLHGLIQRFMG